MDKEIDPGLFARLMRLSPRARKDILEFLGQGPVSSQGMLGVVLKAPGPGEEDTQNKAKAAK